MIHAQDTVFTENDMVDGERVTVVECLRAILGLEGFNIPIDREAEVNDHLEAIKNIMTRQT